MAHRQGQLLDWLQKLSSQERDEDERSRKVRNALRQAEQENNRLRAELRRLGRPDPAAWTVPPEVFAARMSSLPEGIEVGPGRVSVSFSPDDPLSGARKLHELSLAMLNDWSGFIRTVGISDPSRPDRAIDLLSEELEALKRQGVESL
jgi:hypothetical protein